MIKSYTINRDEWEAGDYAICSTCGAHIRHVVEIDGTAFGRDCAASYLGWGEKTDNKIANRFSRVALTIEQLTRFVTSLIDDSGSNDWLDWNDSLTNENRAETLAHAVVEALGLHDPYNRGAGDDWCDGLKYAHTIYNRIA